MFALQKNVSIFISTNIHKHDTTRNHGTSQPTKGYNDRQRTNYFNHKTTTMKKPLSIKLDEELKMKLKSSAKKDGRTLHGYIVNILRLSQQAKPE